MIGPSDIVEKLRSFPHHTAFVSLNAPPVFCSEIYPPALLGEIKGCEEFPSDQFLNEKTLLDARRVLYPDSPLKEYPVSKLSVLRLIARHFHEKFPDRILVTITSHKMAAVEHWHAIKEARKNEENLPLYELHAAPPKFPECEIYLVIDLEKLNPLCIHEGIASMRKLRREKKIFALSLLASQSLIANNEDFFESGLAIISALSE